jgi:hypothetical protein
MDDNEKGMQIKNDKKMARLLESGIQEKGLKREITKNFRKKNARGLLETRMKGTVETGSPG